MTEAEIFDAENADLDAWLTRLEALHPSAIDLGLQRVAAVAERLELLPLPMPVITVAGTNGKGTTVAAIEALAIAGGLNPGASTSPHFLVFNERIRVGGAVVSDDAILDAFRHIERARGDLSLTYFEFGTLAALWVMRAAQVDLAILEVGLGGRLDAVNIVDADVAVITSIALDHQEWLGDTREAIAVEKAGIARAHKPTVVADRDPPATLLSTLGALPAPVYQVGSDWDWVERESDWTLLRASGHSAVESLAPTRLHRDNLGAAVVALELAGWTLSPQSIRQTLGDLRVTGRLDLHRIEDVEYVLDVAHNPASLGRLIEFCSAHPVPGRTLALFCVMSDKDVSAMIDAAHGRFDAWFLADLPGLPRALPAADLGRALHAAGEGMISISKNPRQAFRRAQTLMQPGDRLVVFGSFHTVAGVLGSLEKTREKAQS